MSGVTMSGPDKIDHTGGKLKRTVEGMADAPVLTQIQVRPTRKLVVSLWGPPGEDSLAGCGGVGDGSGAVQLRRVAMLQDRKETSRDTYLLTINVTSWYSSHLHHERYPSIDRNQCSSARWDTYCNSGVEWSGMECFWLIKYSYSCSSSAECINTENEQVFN